MAIGDGWGDYTYGRFKASKAVECDGCCVRYDQEGPEATPGNVNGTHYFGNTTLSCAQSSDGCRYVKRPCGIMLNIGGPGWPEQELIDGIPTSVYIPDCGAVWITSRVEYSGAGRLRGGLDAGGLSQMFVLMVVLKAFFW